MREPFLKFVEYDLGDSFLLIACGLPGTWKTETTEEVAKIKDVQSVETFVVYKAYNLKVPYIL